MTAIGAQCYKCRKNTAQQTAICSRCRSAYQLCNICGGVSWEQSSCPGCKSSSPNWTWAGKGRPGIDEGISYRESWKNRTEERSKQRENEGPGKHHGIEVDENEVKFLRELEDTICMGVFSKSQAQTGPIFEAENGHVTALRLEKVDINEIPASIGGLKHLKSFYYSKGMGIELTKMPESIGECEKLESLALVNASLSELPQSISKLKNIRKLSVSGSLKNTSMINLIFGLETLEELNLECSFTQKYTATNW